MPIRRTGGETTILLFSSWPPVWSRAACHGEVPATLSKRWNIWVLAGEARRGEPGAISCSFRANLASTFQAIITDITLGLGGVPLIIQVGTPSIQCLKLKLKLKPLLVTDTRVATSRCTVSKSSTATHAYGPTPHFSSSR
ncbi:hypothetical protein BDP55DRAFT_398755 [Colletotrichum godetiae]|uniref:Uncharacterized protein n=1 Tax=Colletotrichum godetiae TaxID=1209918 RepID=A0AAJ0AB92_9PEZI|nr:uncharacterized protein BDP55DRAFT_398755 [Colletotrichum godetiae]KAK1658417.1 hypothetical protein BDP55DRAFT_398755 [Colletotrichum godetiae]